MIGAQVRHSIQVRSGQATIGEVSVQVLRQRRAFENAVAARAALEGN